MGAERGRDDAGGQNERNAWGANHDSSSGQFDPFDQSDPDDPTGWTNSIELAERNGRAAPQRDPDEPPSPSRAQITRGPLSSRLYEARRAHDPEYDSSVGDEDTYEGDPVSVAREYTPAPPDAAWTTQAPLLDVSLREYDRLNEELKKLTLLLKQCDHEMAQANHRKTIAGSKVRQMEEKLELYGRQEISDAYHAISDAEKHALMLTEQREQLIAKITTFERFRQFIRRTVNVLMELPPVVTQPPFDEPLAPPPPTPRFTPALAQSPATRPAQPPYPDVHPTTHIAPPPLARQKQPPSPPSANYPPPMGLTTRLSGSLDELTRYPAPEAQGVHSSTERPTLQENAALQRTSSAESHPGSQSTQLAAMTLARVIQSEEELRQRVAQRLHDGPTQSLANLVLTAEICERIVREDPQRALSELTHLKYQVNEALQQTRAFIFELRPMTLNDLGLLPTLRRYAANVAAQKDGQEVGLTITVQAPKGEPRLSPDVETAFFRVAQEAITNAISHGKATEIVITTLASPAHIRLLIDDNGDGFDVDEAVAWAVIRGSTGIASMQERAEMLGGRLRIESARGRGSRVELTAPNRTGGGVNTTNSVGPAHPLQPLPPLPAPRQGRNE